MDNAEIGTEEFYRNQRRVLSARIGPIAFLLTKEEIKNISILVQQEIEEEFKKSELLLDNNH